jgi:signal peptidase II
MPKSFLYGPLTRFGLVAASIVAALDQASKLWLLRVFDLGTRGTVRLTPFLDFVLVWNRGISYGLFQQQSALGQWLLFAIKIVAVALMWIWLSRAQSRLVALALGLIIGGALGNAVDRVLHDGAVVDFASFHVTTATWSFRWYVFNLADAAIVAGVVGLLYESVFAGHAAKAP